MKDPSQMQSATMDSPKHLKIVTLNGEYVGVYANGALLFEQESSSSLGWLGMVHHLAYVGAITFTQYDWATEGPHEHLPPLFEDISFIELAVIS